MVLVVLWGFLVRSSQVGEGTFICRYCGSEQRYVTIERRRWFHLFGVPVLKREIIGVFNHCRGCGRVVEFY